MMKNQRKVIIIVLVILLSLLSFGPVSADEIVEALSNKYVENDVDFNMEFTIDGMNYYPFIYSEKNKWEIENVIGPNSCKEGYLYSKDLRTNRIKQLVNVKINRIYDDKDKIYFIYNNSIYSVDYLGNTLIKYYTGKSYINDQLIKYRNGSIYFIEGDTISSVNEITLEVTTYTKCSNIDLLHVKSDGEIVYRENDNYHLYQVMQRSDRIKRSDADINYLFVDEVYEPDSQIFRSTVNPGQQEDTNLQFVFSLYPDGSYFSDKSTGCDHHYNFNNSNCSYSGNCDCKAYCGAIQCIGFAKYASDKYAHKSSWNAASGDIDETDVQFSTNAVINAYFNGVNTGAYILLAHDSEENNGRHFHAMVFIKKTSDGVMTYECNLASNCNVQLLSRSYTTLNSLYSTDWAIYSVSHTFNGTVQQYNSTYHKKFCSSSGCGGYIYEAHYAINNGANATCIKCGYVGEIYYQEGLVQGNY
ncbi:MAG: hypothetical protein ACI4WG_03270 [Erysipelotrichaceae bacterium]